MFTEKRLCFLRGRYVSWGMKKELRDYLSKLGRKGGKARKKSLTKAELSEQGRKAVQARWAKRKAGK